MTSLRPTLIAAACALCFASPETRWRVCFAALIILAVPAAAQFTGSSPFAVADTKGHLGDRILFSKWSGSEIRLEGVDYLVMKESDVIGVVA